MKKKKITLLIAGAFLCLGSINAQTSCPDLNGYVNSKNVGGTSSYTLQNGFEEHGAQTYRYSGPGKISSVRVYGSYPGFIGGVPLRISICNVDALGRPTTTIQSANTIWWVYDNINGYINVPFSGSGVNVINNFAVTVQILNLFPFGTTFHLQYTGNGEGLGQDLASLAGTSTGGNWSSAKNTFNKDGDFYLVPMMTHYITPGFTMPSACHATGATVSFSNTTLMTCDSMFNKIGLSGYSGPNSFFTWNFGDGSPTVSLTNPTHAYASPGVYTVSLTSKIDGWNSVCSATYTSLVSVGLSVGATAISSVSCNGGSNGAFTATGSGGAPTYSYSLNGYTYQGSAGFSGLTSGIKTIFVKDQLGCTSSNTFMINQPQAITFNAASTTNASCGNTNGGVLVSAQGGAGPLQYKIDNGSLQPTGAFTSIAAGIHTITAQDVNACTLSTLVPVNDLGGPTIANALVTQVSCNGNNNGSIIVTAGGGSGGLQYSLNGGAAQSNGTFSGLTAGTYAIVVKDALNCTDMASVVINQPPALAVNANALPTTCFGSANGQIQVISSTGGTGLHNYSINGTNYQSGQNFSSLSSGIYTVYVKDIANCIGTSSIAVSQPAPINAVLSVTAASCNGSSDGIISAAASGGTGSFQYAIDNLNFQPSGIFGDLPAGTYTVMVKDVNNCSYFASVVVGQPAAISTTVGTTNSTCGNSNGGALVLANGGAGGFQYSINGTNFNNTGQFSFLASGTYYIIVKDATGCSNVVPATVIDSNGPTILSQSYINVSCNGGNNGSISITNVSGGSGTLQYSFNGLNWQISPTFNNLPAGNYVITVKDANNCTGTIAVTLTEPNGFIINPIVTNAVCNAGASGAATITAAGGAGVLAYSINGLFYQSNNIFTGLTAGTYNVIVKDAANCTGIQTFVINEPPAINISTGVLNVTCNGANNGVISITANGGTGSLLYSLNGSPYASATFFTNLPGNTNYFVTVKDANNCIKSQPVFITEPLPIAIAPIVNNVSCAGGNNGAINLSVSGGTSPYGYQWSNGESGQGIFNLPSGVYSVNIVDFNGCSSSASYTVSQPSNPLTINALITGSSNGNDGTIDITVTGGTPPYIYNWSNNSFSEDLSGLSPGAYLVTVTDASGCVSSSTFLVSNLVGISERQLATGQLLIYPNPATHQITIHVKDIMIEQVDLYNMLGERVTGYQLYTSVAEITTSGLARGTYFLKITANRQIFTRKITLID